MPALRFSRSPTTIRNNYYSPSPASSAYRPSGQWPMNRTRTINLPPPRKRSKRPLAPPGRRPPPFSRAMRRSATFPRLPFHHLPNRAPRSLSPEWDDHNGFEIVITPPSSRGSIIVADVRKLPELPKPAEQNDAARISFERRHEVEVDQLWQDTVTLSELNSRDHSSYIELRNKLGIDKLSAMTLKGYNVRGHLDHDGPALCYPRYRSARGIDGRRPVGLKLIRLLGEKLEKKNYPNSEEDTNFQYYSGIFGWHMVRPSDKKVVVTTNERDAMAVYDATGELAVALPRGEKVDQQVLPYLEDFDKVVFWFPTYQQTHARNYAAYLAGSRCFIVTHRERPIEVARHGRLDDIKAILSSDQTKRVVRSTEQFRTTTDHRTGVRNEIVNHKRNLSGLAQWKRFPVLNKYLLGFRQGELTVLTGGTGVGKTTFVCEYAIDLMTQGVRYLFHHPDNRYFLPLQMRTLLCSFEMRDVKVLKWMVVQLAG
uniref:SF4 helicase domain-containing protein n=1 Tax=Plectus sambesii TaxID=2011161 RepID=A0A914XDP4_9BILA